MLWLTNSRGPKDPHHARAVRLAYPEVTTAPNDERDIAVAAVSCIGATGPELLNQADRVSAFAAILDHAIALFTPVQAATSEPVGRQLVSEHTG